MSFLGSRLMAFQARRVANASRRTAMTGPGSRETQNLAPTVSIHGYISRPITDRFLATKYSYNWNILFSHFQGLKWKEIKVHYSLIPLWGVMGVATFVVIAYIGRLATNRDVNWFKREEPWNYYSDKRWKLMQSPEGNPTVHKTEFNNHQCQAPKYKDE